MDRNRMMYFAGQIAREVSETFVRNGGRITENGREMRPDDVASPHGALGALVWWASEYVREYALPFPNAVYAASDTALAGYELRALDIPEATGGAMTLYIFSDFLRKELFNEHVLALDLTPPLESFRAWCDLHVERGPSDMPGAPSDQEPE